MCRARLGGVLATKISERESSQHIFEAIKAAAERMEEKTDRVSTPS